MVARRVCHARGVADCLSVSECACVCVAPGALPAFDHRDCGVAQVVISVVNTNTAAFFQAGSFTGPAQGTAHAHAGVVGRAAAGHIAGVAALVVFYARDLRRGGRRGGVFWLCGVHRGGVGRAGCTLVARRVCHARGVADCLSVSECACVCVAPGALPAFDHRDCGVAQVVISVVNTNTAAFFQAGSFTGPAQGTAHAHAGVVGRAAAGHIAGVAALVVFYARDLRRGGRRGGVFWLCGVHRNGSSCSRCAAAARERGCGDKRLPALPHGADVFY